MNINQSDKFFWHGYIDFYEGFLKNRNFRKIAEIGVSRGFSIRWLLEKYPEAKIHGADIIPFQDEWPKDPRFIFTQMDQGDKNKVDAFFSSADFEFIIEDGSHIPEHQVIALTRGVKGLKSGGIYILEDIHTSHPTAVRRSKRGLEKLKTPKGNALSVLLGIAHYKKIGTEIGSKQADLLSQNSLMTSEEVLFLANNLSEIHLYRRTRLPEYCVECGSKDYNFSTYRCFCGRRIFSDYDSMTFVLIKK